MAGSIRIPITVKHGNCFALELSVGVPPVSVSVLLDTGSSMLLVNAPPYREENDTIAATSKLLQQGSLRGIDFLAAVIRTQVAFRTTAGGETTSVSSANLGVIYRVMPLFGDADGILGLAYPPLNPATTMPADTWDACYGPAALLVPGLRKANLATFMSQLAVAHQIADKFAFSIGRSVASAADAALNSGIFVIGQAEECKDLYTGDFQSAAVVHDAYYHTNLQRIQIGGHDIDVDPTPAGDPAISNSIIDSGAGNIGLAPGLYQKVIDRFNEVAPTFGDRLRAGVQNQDQLRLADWPPIGFVLQGLNGATATVTVASKDYWRCDGAGAGKATAALSSGGAPKPGQSVLGLPLLAGHYVVFDRTGGSGKSVIKFASRRDPGTASLVA